MSKYGERKRREKERKEKLGRIENGKHAPIGCSLSSTKAQLSTKEKGFSLDINHLGSFLQSN